MDKPFKFCITKCRVVTCARTVNDKIRWTGHTSFAHITRGNIKMASNVCGEVDEVREERLRKRECYLIEWFILSSGSYSYFYCKRVVACSQL